MKRYGLKNWKKYTFQTLSDSGSFAFPDGLDVHHCSSMKVLREWLVDWAYEHSRVGADEKAAVLRVWRGGWSDVTDLYPDFDLRYGPRGGIVKEVL